MRFVYDSTKPLPFDIVETETAASKQLVELTDSIVQVIASLKDDKKTLTDALDFLKKKGITINSESDLIERKEQAIKLSNKYDDLKAFSDANQDIRVSDQSFEKAQSPEANTKTRFDVTKTSPDCSDDDKDDPAKKKKNQFKPSKKPWNIDRDDKSNFEAETEDSNVESSLINV